MTELETRMLKRAVDGAAFEKVAAWWVPLVLAAKAAPAVLAKVLPWVAFFGAGALLASKPREDFIRGFKDFITHDPAGRAALGAILGGLGGGALGGWSGAGIGAGLGGLTGYAWPQLKSQFQPMLKSWS